MFPLVPMSNVDSQWQTLAYKTIPNGGGIVSIRLSIKGKKNMGSALGQRIVLSTKDVKNKTIFITEFCMERKEMYRERNVEFSDLCLI